MMDQNNAKRVIINQMVSRIKDLEAENRDLEMQNYRLQNRIRVLEEHKANTDRSRRESSEMLEELYCKVMQRFEKLQAENNRTKSQLRDLAKEVAQSNCENPAGAQTCPRSMAEYDSIVESYEIASDNFLKILARHYKEMEEAKKRKDAAKKCCATKDQSSDGGGCKMPSPKVPSPGVCPIDSEPGTDSITSCRAKSCKKQPLGDPFTPDPSMAKTPSDDSAMFTAIGGGSISRDVDLASNISTRGTTVPPPTPSTACGCHKECTFWPDDGKMIHDLGHEKSVVLGNKSDLNPAQKKPSRNVCQGGLDGNADESVIEGKKESFPFVEDEVGDHGVGKERTPKGGPTREVVDDDSDLIEESRVLSKLKCHACEMSGSKSIVAKSCDCKWKADKEGGVRPKEAIHIPEAPKKVLRRQEEVQYEDSEEDLLEDMRLADEEQRLQRSATPEPSARRLRPILKTPGVVSYSKSSTPQRSQSVDREGSECKRRPSIPRIISDKIDTVKKFVEDFVKTLLSPSKAKLDNVISQPEVKLRGTPGRR